MSARDLIAPKTATKWESYEVTLHAETLCGGVPKDPDTIRKWISARMELQDKEFEQIAEETIAQMGWTREQIDPAVLVDKIVAQIAGNGFKMVDGAFVYEGRCLKAALVEAASVLYPGRKKWPGFPMSADGKGEVAKGLRSYFVERVEVRDRFIPIGKTQGQLVTEQRIKHIKTPQGPASAINVVDVASDVTLHATIDVLGGENVIPAELWAELWEYVERGGIGADRARQDGRCEVIAWRKVTTTAARGRRAA